MSNLADVDKKLLKLIKRQLEFYFSEGNLPRDEFMQNCIKLSKHNSILIEDMLKFNKLIELNASTEMIKLAVRKSKILTFDDEETGIKRKIELENLKPVNTRTIFISGFLNDENQKKSSDEIVKELKKKFKIYGQILRIDLPKYPSSQNLRGFGFIEFMTKTETRKALKEYKLSDIELRKAESWKYFSFSNNQYSHALKQLEILGHPQKVFFDQIIGQQRKQKINTKISAIAKKEWLIFRNQFYEAQQNHLNEMKALIGQYQSTQQNANPCSHKQHERVKAEQAMSTTNQIGHGSSKTVTVQLSEQIVSGSIVAFSCSENNTKKTIKSSLTEMEMLDNIAYIDFRDFSLNGYFRFKNSENACKFTEMKSSIFSETKVLTAQQEHEYLEKIFQDKQSKQENQKRKNLRKRKHKEISEEVK